MSEFSKILLAALTVVALTLPLKWVREAFAAPPAANPTWDGTYETWPTGTDNVSDGDDWLRDIKIESRERLQTEHNFGTLGATSDDDGRHREGSARAFYEADCTAVTLNQADHVPGGGAGSTAMDEGRICWDSDDNEPHIYDAGAGAFEGIGALGGDGGEIDLLDNVVFDKAGTGNTMDIHSHQARHGVGGSDEFEKLEQWDNTVDTTDAPLAAATRTTTAILDNGAGMVIAAGANAAIFVDFGASIIQDVVDLEYLVQVELEENVDSIGWNVVARSHAYGQARGANPEFAPMTSGARYRRTVAAGSTYQYRVMINNIIAAGGAVRWCESETDVVVVDAGTCWLYVEAYGIP